MSKMKLDDLFTSGMVLPVGREIRIFGEGDGVASISFAGVSATSESADGKWEILFPSMDCGGPYEMDVDLNGEKITLDNIFVGKVYIFAGQSNMQFKLHESKTTKNECNPSSKMRLFSSARLEEGEFFFPSDGWISADSSEIEKWPAIPYLVTEYLSQKEDIAVGAITAYQGASVIETWIPRGALKNIGIDIPLDLRHYDHTKPKYIWNAEGTLYDFTFSKIAPYGANGVVWYQGESDTTDEEGKIYADELSLLINTWRDDLGDDRLPFVVVQLADLDSRRDDAWRSVQESQRKVGEEVTGVKTVISRDVCETNDIHPPTKSVLSQRIAEALMSFDR